MVDHDHWRLTWPKLDGNMLRVVCVWTGNKYPRVYVERLKNMVERNLSLRHEFRVIDDRVIPVEEKSSWWSKLHLFDPKVVPPGRTLYLDLDVVITGDLGALVSAYAPPMTICDNFLGRDHCPYNSSIMLWESGHPRVTALHDRFMTDRALPKETMHGDQDFIARHAGLLATFPQELVSSYKRDCRSGHFPEGSCVTVFHGKPNPHQVEDAWVKEFWR